MNAKELRGKAANELSDELLKLRREQFSLRMQRATGQAVKPHDFGRVRKDIARLKTVLAEKASAAALATQRYSAASSPASDTTAMARFFGSWN